MIPRSPPSSPSSSHRPPLASRGPAPRFGGRAANLYAFDAASRRSARASRALAAVFGHYDTGSARIRRARRAAAAALALLPAAALATGVLEDTTGIAAAFAFVTFVPQNFWLLLVFAPNWKWTRRIFEPLWPLCVVALAHLYIVGASAGKPPEAGTAPLELFNNLFNPVAVSERGIDVYVELGSYRNFAAEEWTHELVWDLFVGRWIWLKAGARNLRARACSPT